ncbi:hypothetical protein F503_02511 [Ophiostoma piceae UAMH 11346]|uniref:Uncharacterized protein n=1 Tax=Ophiostoma piceae (strain UAMH 11346) TaxID=1262450 RepID=S3CIZ7_OPHP1|nr:hypothetical protein F503_02511 [Ophiostoma piceae UAMH 11346]
MEIDLGLSPSTSDGDDDLHLPDDDLADEDVRLLFSLAKPVVIDDSSSETSSSSSSSSASSTEDPSAPPRITLLRGIDSFDAWEASLRANLEFHGVSGFLETGSDDDKNRAKTRNRAAAERRPRQIGGLAFAHTPEKRKRNDTEDGEEAKRRRRGSLLAYVEDESEPAPAAENASPSKIDLRFVTDTTKAMYNPLIKRPRYHFEAAVDHIVRLAAASGYTASLVQRLCMADRMRCDSLAAYQRLLTETRRSLSRVHANPGDDYMVWMALQGLKQAHPRWRQLLIRRKASPQGLDWDSLMEAMSARACREKVGSSSGSSGGHGNGMQARQPSVSDIESF